MKIIGINLKKLRESKGIGLRKLAKQLNLSPSFLSQLEGGKATPSLVTLKNIADSLHTTVGALIGENQKPSYNPVIKAGERKHQELESKGINIYLLTTPDPNKLMEPLWLSFEPGATSGASPYMHYGQEFVTIIEGALELTLNDKVYVLNKGDSIYFNSNIPHAFRNISLGKTEAVWVDTPPTF